MKYTFTFSTLLVATLLGANESNFDVSGMMGYTIADEEQYLDNYGVYGAEIQYDGFELAFKPEFSIYVSNAGYKYDTGDTKVYRYALNGVYEFKNGNTVTPFFKAGVGYEEMSDPLFGNRDSGFIDAGAGVKIDLTEKVAFKLEAIKMLKFNHSSFDDNLLLIGGLNFTFGNKVQKGVEHVVTPEPKTPIDPVAVVQKPITVTTIITEPVKVSTPIDSDSDGVLDSNDRCQNSPSRFKIDENGCPLKATIHDHFVFNSDHIDSTAASEIRAFVVFMKENPLYSATITGHTDSIGTPEHNQILSEKRAEKVKNALVTQGIASERLIVIGKGESMPIVSNMLKEGRAENRRIELDLHE